MNSDIRIENLIKEIVKNSKNAGNEIENKSNKFINKLIIKIASIVLNKKNNYFLSSMAVKETKFGNIEDKIKKNIYKTKNLLNEIIKTDTLIPKFDKKKKYI